MLNIQTVLHVLSQRVDNRGEINLADVLNDIIEECPSLDVPMLLEEVKKFEDYIEDVKDVEYHRGIEYTEKGE